MNSIVPISVRAWKGLFWHRVKISQAVTPKLQTLLAQLILPWKKNHIHNSDLHTFKKVERLSFLPTKSFPKVAT